MRRAGRLDPMELGLVVANVPQRRGGCLGSTACWRMAVAQKTLALIPRDLQISRLPRPRESSGERVFSLLGGERSAAHAEFCWVLALWQNGVVIPRGKMVWVLLCVPALFAGLR